MAGDGRVHGRAYSRSSRPSSCSLFSPSRPPPLPDKSQVRFLEGRPIRPGTSDEEKQWSRKAAADKDADNDPVQQQWDSWRAGRSAIVHTVDISPQYSAHAEKIVRGFRRGIYAGNVDFYVGHIGNWVTEQKKRRASAGLRHRGTGPVGAVERRSEIPIKLRSIGQHAGSDRVEGGARQAERIGLGLQHQGRDGAHENDGSASSSTTCFEREHRRLSWGLVDMSGCYMSQIFPIYSYFYTFM